MAHTRSLIVGTGGHIDHGKSALVHALTGTDPDRLKEEKERGITIDLGFAHMDLGQGVVASFIDVPGHERFVRNMLAGAHGIDAALLVVAADESVMPQTREHFHICRLLGIRSGLVALTKCDVADAEMQALAEMEVRELVAGSFLERAPVLRVSARTGEGLEALKAGLRDLARGTEERSSESLLRLPIDRCFSLRGFGTVVTGTLVGGRLALGDEVELLPSGRRARVRGLQVHGHSAERVEAGHRTAVNLAGVDVPEVARGDVLAQPGTLRPTSLIEVDLSLLPGERVLKDQARVRVHLASAEVLARVRLLQAREIGPGATARALLRLERPAVAGRGDRLVIRAYSPAATIGGAVVLDPLSPKRLRGPLAPASALTAIDAAMVFVEEAGPAGIAGPDLAARVTVPLRVLLEGMSPRGDVAVFGKDPPTLVSRRALEGQALAVRNELVRFHAEFPLRPGMPREELRRRVFSHSPDGAYEHVLSDLAASELVRVVADAVALSSHAVRLTPEETGAREVLLEAASKSGLEGIETTKVAAATGQAQAALDRVAKVLLAEGLLRRVGEALVHRDHLDELQAAVRRRWPAGSRLDVGDFKELTGLSRKFVIPLLEYLDRVRVTRRTGNDRYVMAEASSPPRMPV